MDELAAVDGTMSRVEIENSVMSRCHPFVLCVGDRTMIYIPLYIQSDLIQYLNKKSHWCMLRD